MLIINADDWGRTPVETDAALACHRSGRVTSVSAMVFMHDSERAAQLAQDHGLDVGLHLNLSQRYNGRMPSKSIADAQSRIVTFMLRSKYAVLFYHPSLRTDFQTVYDTQIDEFTRLYGQLPSHVDGHQHRHLCANMMIDPIIPRGQKVRRNFSFSAGEKNFLNRTYRSLIDKWLHRRYRLVDHFFSLSQCLESNGMDRVTDLARVSTVELMAHPVKSDESAYLMSDAWLDAFGSLPMGTYAQV